MCDVSMIRRTAKAWNKESSFPEMSDQHQHVVDSYIGYTRVHDSFVTSQDGLDIETEDTSLSPCLLLVLEVSEIMMIKIM